MTSDAGNKCALGDGGRSRQRSPEETSFYSESELRAVIETAAKTSRTEGEEPESSPAIGHLQEDLSRLRDEVERQTEQTAGLARTVASLELELETARKDHETRQADFEVEAGALRNLLERAQGRLTELLAEADNTLLANHELKAQNLELQYQLNLWGIPVTTGDDAGAELTPPHGRTFFPRLRSSEMESDPARPILRGDLGAFKTPDIISLLGNCGATGILTILSEGTAVKFYLEHGVLRMAGWNKLDPGLGLVAILQEMGAIGETKGQRLHDSGMSDMEAAETLRQEGSPPIEKIRGGLRRQAGRILSRTLGLERGVFLFHGGTIEEHREILFDCPITNAILEAARETDERQQDPARRP